MKPHRPLLKRIPTIALRAATLLALLSGPVMGQGTPAERGQEPSVQPTRPAAAETDAQRRKEAYILYPKAVYEAARGDLYRAMEITRQVISLDPQSPEPRVLLGELHYGLRNTSEARSEALEALKLDPDHAGAHRLLGRIYRDDALATGEREKAQQAIEEFRRVTASDESDIEAWQSLAQLYGLTGNQEESVNALIRLTSSDPTADGAFTLLANHYFSQRKYREAAENSAQAYSLNPDWQNAILLARSMLAQGQTADALRVFEEARRRNPNQSELDVSYSEALVYSGQYEEAITTLRAELATNPENTEALRLLAQAYRRSGRRQEAVQVLKDALKGIDVSDSLNIQYVLAQTYEELREIDRAVETYEGLLDSVLNPDGTVSKSYDKAAEEILTRIGLVYRDAGRQDEALRTFERMRSILGAENPQPDLLVLDTLMEDHRYEDVVVKARAAAKQYPDKRDFTLVEAQALGYLGKVNEAFASLDQLMSNSMEDLPVLMTKAAIASDAERYVDAKAALEEGLRRDPRNAGLLIQLSMVQEKLGLPAEAESTLRGVLERDPENHIAMNNLGYYLAERGERLDESLSLIQRAVNIDPTSGSFLDSLGWVYFQMGRLDEAQRYLEEAVIYAPRDGTVHEHLGDLFLRRGQEKEARSAFEQALKWVRRTDERERIQKKLDGLPGKEE